jgi:hypothetical protein
MLLDASFVGVVLGTKSAEVLASVIVQRVFVLGQNEQTVTAEGAEMAAVQLRLIRLVLLAQRLQHRSQLCSHLQAK